MSDRQEKPIDTTNLYNEKWRTHIPCSWLQNPDWNTPGDCFNELSRIPEEPIQLSDGRDIAIVDWYPDGKLTNIEDGILPIDARIQIRNTEKRPHETSVEQFNRLSQMPPQQDHPFNLPDGRAMSIIDWCPEHKEEDRVGGLIWANCRFLMFKFVEATWTKLVKPETKEDSDD